MTAPAATPRALLRRRDAVAIVVGIVVGAGIFRAPAVVAGATGDAGWSLALWAAGALVSLVGALCYAELASTYPHAGGDYHFLARAYGRDLAFFYGWGRATVINGGSLALLGFVFGDYASRLVTLGTHSPALWAAAVIVALTLVNLASLVLSARAQSWLTVAEVGGLLLVVAAGASVPAHDLAWFARSPGVDAAGFALVFVLLTYGGWNEAAYVSAEVRGGHRAILHTLAVAVAIIALLYLATNVALLRGLGVAGLADAKTAAADVVTRAFGNGAGELLAALVAVATLTSINATMLVGARTHYALAHDWAALHRLRGWHAARGVPVPAFLVQAAIALALVAFGAAQKDGFEAMVEFTAPVFWGFLTLVGIALPLLRRRDPQAVRPFRVPLYPLTPIVFIAACLFLLHASVTYAASQRALHVSLGVMATGAIAWVLLRVSASRARAR